MRFRKDKLVYLVIQIIIVQSKWITYIRWNKFILYVMKTKLTLYLEKSVIEGMKEHARRMGVSLSQFIEREYKTLSQTKVEEPIPKYFKKMQFEDDIPSATDWKKERGDYLEEKHG